MNSIASLMQYDTPLFVEHTSAAADQDVVGKRSNCIPGALAIDPYLRKVTQATGMTVSEQASWLLVVAMKEYTKELIKSVIDASKATQDGELPLNALPAFNSKPKALSKKRDIQDNLAATEHCDVRRCITSFDVHAFTSRTRVGNARSIGGSVSRQAFESSMFASLPAPVTCGGSDYDHLHSFITSKFEESFGKPRLDEKVSIKTQVDPNQPEGSGGRLTSMKPGGLGRGAKDLASLKMRSSINAKKQDERVEASADSDLMESAAAGTLDNFETHDLSVESKDASQQAQHIRKGKGIGMKNLAAMRARSVTVKPENSYDMTEPDAIKVDEAISLPAEEERTATQTEQRSSLQLQTLRRSDKVSHNPDARQQTGTLADTQACQKQPENDYDALQQTDKQVDTQACQKQLENDHDAQQQTDTPAGQNLPVNNPDALHQSDKPADTQAGQTLPVNNPDAQQQTDTQAGQKQPVKKSPTLTADPQRNQSNS
jgi:hypothetical protein